MMLEEQRVSRALNSGRTERDRADQDLHVRCHRALGALTIGRR